MRTSLTLRIFAAIIMIVCVSFNLSAKTIYVTQTGTDDNDGLNWATAKATISHALSVALSGDEIWVAKGTYFPTSDTDRTLSFTLEPGCKLYGGFAGTETILTERTHFGLGEVNETILSGDIGTPSDLSDNSYHVVVLSGLSGTLPLINGFTVRDGNANLSEDNHHLGGGILINGGVIENCRIINNTAVAGAGLAIINQAEVTNSNIANNYATDIAGGIFCLSSAYFENDTITNNTAANSCGGIYTYSFGTYKSCVISANSSGYDGGGIFTTDGGTFINCKVLSNQCTHLGAGIFASDGGLFINCLVADNQSTFNGGGLYSLYHSEWINCSIVNNRAQKGAGAYVSEGAEIANTILWGNTASIAGSQYLSDGAMVDFINCAMQGGSTLPDTDILELMPANDGDDEGKKYPRFSNPTTGDYHLEPRSDCVNQGNNTIPLGMNLNANSTDGNTITSEVDTDVDGAPRVVAFTIDMGAFERDFDCTWCMTSENNFWNNPDNWVGGVPTAGDYVYIPNLPTPPVVQPTTTINVDFIEVAEGTTLTLQSNASNSSSLIASLGTIGQFAYERFVSDFKWHLFASPVKGQPVNKFLSNSTNNILIHPSTNHQALIRYREMDDLWISYADESDAYENFEASYGYGIKRGGDGVVTFKGEVESGTVTRTLNRDGEGWNLVGNPFTSAIALTQATDATTNFLTTNLEALDPNYAALYLWDEQANYEGSRSDYKVISNAGFTLPGEPKILDQDHAQVGQAFFVRVKASGSSISFTPQMQQHATAVPLKSAENWPGISLSLKGINGASETVITFHKNMTMGLDPTYDAGKLKGSSPVQLYTQLPADNEHDFAIQALPVKAFNGLEIPIGVDADEAETLIFTSKTAFLPPDCKVILEDRAMGTFTDLTETGYQINSTAELAGTGRFFLHTEGTLIAADDVNANKLKLFLSNNTLHIVGKVSENAEISLYDLLGHKISGYPLHAGNRNQLKVGSIKPGIYLAKVQDGVNLTQQKIIF